MAKLYQIAKSTFKKVPKGPQRNILALARDVPKDRRAHDCRSRKGRGAHGAQRVAGVVAIPTRNSGRTRGGLPRQRGPPPRRRRRERGHRRRAVGRGNRRRATGLLINFHSFLGIFCVFCSLVCSRVLLK